MLRLQAPQTARAVTTAILVVWAFLCASIPGPARAEARTIAVPAAREVVDATPELSRATRTHVREYDGLGRPIEAWVDGVGLPPHTTSTQGQVSSTTDPFGGVAFTYDGLGYEASATRSWMTGPDTVFVTGPDLQGQPESVTFPSGRVVAYDRSNGVLTRTTIGGTTIDHTYTSWGAPESWTSNVGASGFTEWNTPLWPSMVELTNGSMVRDRTYTWYDNGLMRDRGATGKFTETYAYDGQRQLTQVDEVVAGLQESYAYDGAGNITVHTDRAGRTWTHSVNDPRNQISERSDGTVTEGYTYDGAGRLAVVTVDAGSGPFPRSSYIYDGLGRLVIATDTGDTWSYGRDAAGDVVVRSGPGGETRSFRGWTKQSGGAVSEDVAPMLTYAGTERRWHLKEVDGTTVVTSKDLGMVVGHRRQGVYGQRFVEGGSPERKAAFHGRWEEEAGLVAMGPRHANRVDGRWLQPEPLLVEGIPQEMLGDPRSLAQYRYARNAPGTYLDPSGNNPVGAAAVAYAVFEVVGTGADILAVAASAHHAWTVGRVTTALVVDVSLTAVGLVSPAAGMAGGGRGLKQVVSMADGAIDATRAAGAADEAAAVASGGGQQFFRGAKPGEAPDFTPRPGEFKVEKDIVKDAGEGGRGVSVFDNPESVVSKALYRTRSTKQRCRTPSASSSGGRIPRTMRSSPPRVPT
jgi:RHS repeat-associated protein